MLSEDLTEPERRVWNAADGTDLIDFRDPEKPAAEDLASGLSWGAERSVRAEVLVALLTIKPGSSEQPQRALRLAGARILGTLDLAGLLLSRPLVLEACFFANAVRLDDARAPRVELRCCRIPALSARQFETRGDLTLDGLRGAREVVLVGARIGGLLGLRDARLENADGVALDGSWADVHIEMDCRHLQATGEVRLIGAHIGLLRLGGACLSSTGAVALNADALFVQHLSGCPIDGKRFEVNGEVRLLAARIGGVDFEGVKLNNAIGPALNADGLRVEQDMFCRTIHEGRFEADGDLRLVGAHIGGGLFFEGARLSNAGGNALTAGGLEVERDVVCRAAVGGQSFEATGALSLLGSRIGGELRLDDAHLSNPQGLALDLESARAHEVRLPGDPPDGIVDLTDAVVDQFHDGWQRSRDGHPARGYPVRLQGFVYQSLGSGSAAVDERLDWIRHAEEGYIPHAYDQLEGVFRRAGREDDACRVAIAKQRARRRKLPMPEKAASFLLDVCVGYGYRTWRAVCALLVIVLIGWGVFASAFPEHLRPTRAVGELPTFHPLLYSIDAVLPVIDLGQKSAWTPTGAAQIWYAFSVVSGWLLGLGLIAYLTAKLFRE